MCTEYKRCISKKLPVIEHLYSLVIKRWKPQDLIHCYCIWQLSCWVYMPDYHENSSQLWYNTGPTSPDVVPALGHSWVIPCYIKLRCLDHRHCPWANQTGNHSKQNNIEFPAIPGRTKTHLASQLALNICITFVQCWTNVEDVGPTLYKCYTNVLCLLGAGLPTISPLLSKPGPVKP